jgi:hypothetical protein
LRTRLSRGLAALAAAFAVIVPGAAQPAQATVPAVPPPAGPVIIVVFSFSGLFGGGGGGGLSPEAVQQLVREVTGAVNVVRAEVQQHLDTHVAADVNVALTSAQIEMLDFEVWKDDELTLWANATKFNGWANTARSYFEIVRGPIAADKIGLAINTLYPLAIMVRSEAGLLNGARELLRDQIAANRRILEQLAPVCGYRPVAAPPGHVEQYYECVAYDGTTAQEREVFVPGVGYTVGPIDDAKKEEIKLRAAEHTSWAVAVHTLPELERALAELSP